MYQDLLESLAMGPVHLALKDVTGLSQKAEDIRDDFVAIYNSLPAEVQLDVVVGLLDTPSANVKAFRLLEEALPKQVWTGCMAHEISLLMKDICKLASSLAINTPAKLLVSIISCVSAICATPPTQSGLSALFL